AIPKAFRTIGIGARLCPPRAICQIFVLLVTAWALPAWGQNLEGWQEFSPGAAYRNDRVADVPWSVHIGRIDRSKGDIEIHSVHARGKALGLATLSAIVNYERSQLGSPLVGVNGDFYQMRGRPFEGDPRGLQIMNGELLSGPSEGISFWVDAGGQPHLGNVTSRFQMKWPGGKQTSLGVNDQRRAECVLYTPAAGGFTGTSSNGVELILELSGDGPWLPLKTGASYHAKVQSVIESGNSRIGPWQMVLSVPANLKRTIPKVEAGTVLEFSTATAPDLRGVTSAISGGPILVRDGKWQELPKAASGSVAYGERTKYERHPRSAIGWNDNAFYVVEVDGRQPGLSVGMTLEELGKYMIKLGCTEVMNLDGGGSAMFWANGKIQSSPCEGHEREIANALIVVRKEKQKAEAGGAKLASP
ncbi:MAG: metallophosphoesterase, partial [Verrucomicrobiales bacterium]|nr:metallophosphoesterase [Verrucomicrobiales bacterium]